MARQAKPYLHQGWWVTTQGGKYRKLCREEEGEENARRLLSQPLLLSQVLPAYFNFCKTYYRLPNGSISRDVYNIEKAFTELTDANAPAELTKEHLNRARDEMLERGLCRKYINQRIGRVRRCIAWMHELNYVSDKCAMMAKVYRNLPAFRSSARETDPVEAVEWSVVERTLTHLHDPWKSMVLLQWYTGMRPGEVCNLTISEVIRTSEPWIIDKGKNHKTAWKQKKRRLAVGPQAREILSHWIKIAEINERQFLFRGRQNIKTCILPVGYSHAIAKICKKHGIPTWTPNQLRHAYATRVRAAFGLDAAQSMLGHSSADISQIYAELDYSKQAAIAAKLG